MSLEQLTVWRKKFILTCISGICCKFVSGNSGLNFRIAKNKRFGVTKAVEIVGEVSYKLTNEFKEMYPEIEWRNIISMRHILVHGYYQTKDIIVWKTVRNDFPALKEKIQKIYDTEI